MEKRTSFKSTDRYEFDFGICSSENGFAQIDTTQDAWYYGTWANPFTFVEVSYCEGDITFVMCENEAEFVKRIRSTKAWNDEGGYWKGIDAGLDDKATQRWQEIGLGDLMH